MTRKHANIQYTIFPKLTTSLASGNLSIDYHNISMRENVDWFNWYNVGIGAKWPITIQIDNYPSLDTSNITFIKDTLTLVSYESFPFFLFFSLEEGEATQNNLKQAIPLFFLA